MLISRSQKGEQIHNLEISNKAFGNMSKLRCMGTIISNESDVSGRHYEKITVRGRACHSLGG
jgi:hypothetical protein